MEIIWMLLKQSKPQNTISRILVWHCPFNHKIIIISDVPEDNSALLDPGHVGAVDHEDEPVHLHY